MNKDLIIKIAFGVSLFCGLIGSYLAIMHISFPVPLIAISVIAGLLYSVLALMEIFSYNRINYPEKIMWIVGFLFFNPISGLLYFVLRRKYITRTPKFYRFDTYEQLFP